MAESKRKGRPTTGRGVGGIQINLRLSKTEGDLLRGEADKNKVTLQEYIRRRALGQGVIESSREKTPTPPTNKKDVLDPLPKGSDLKEPELGQSQGSPGGVSPPTSPVLPPEVTKLEASPPAEVREPSGEAPLSRETLFPRRLSAIGAGFTGPADSSPVVASSRRGPGPGSPSRAADPDEAFRKIQMQKEDPDE